MPATLERKRKNGFVLGVDGCPYGWVFVALSYDESQSHSGVVKTIDDLLSGPGRDASVIMIDMPIGLKDLGKRQCENDARQFLGKRRSSIFPSPRRRMLEFDHYADANQWGKDHGAGLSKQSWNILHKIRELDQVMTPTLQCKAKEAHPEVAFTRLKGMPCDNPKKHALGKAERLKALADNNFPVSPEDLYLKLMKHHRAKDVKRDDLIDACALALTGTAFMKGEHVRFADDNKDAHGLSLEIHG